MKTNKCRLGLVSCLVLLFGINCAFADFLEWSDITPQQGRYSKIYFDYVGTTFYVVNDWFANQDGMRPDEFNRFTFKIGTTPIEIRIYPDGGQVLGGTLTNFKSATGWGKSPNLDTDHMIWEFQFDVEPTRIYQFIGCDPASTTVVTTPPPVTGVTTGPSEFAHVTDGVFTSFSSLQGVPVPSRDSIAPVPDPLFPNGFNLSLKEGGGVFSDPIPEPGTLGLLGIGIGLVLFSRWESRKRDERRCDANPDRCC